MRFSGAFLWILKELKEVSDDLIIGKTWTLPG
jgi:hypothetical protein